MISQNRVRNSHATGHFSVSELICLQGARQEVWYTSRCKGIAQGALHARMANPYLSPYHQMWARYGMAKAKAKATATAKMYTLANAFLRRPILVSDVLTGGRS